MSLRLRRPPAAALALIAGILVVDQVTKAFVVANMDRLPVDVVGGVRLEFVRNTGVSFSLFQGRGWLVTLLVCLVVAMVLVLFLTMPRRYSIPLAVLLGGSLANLIDRFRYGYVVDFVALWWWPRFNVADLAIIVGAGLTVLAVVLNPGVRPAQDPDSGHEGAGVRDGHDSGPPDAAAANTCDPEDTAVAACGDAPETPAAGSGEEAGGPDDSAGRPADH